MTRQEALSYCRRYQLMNRIEIAELRKTPLSRKVQQMASLMQLAIKMNWHTSLPSELRQVQQRWNRLRKSSHG